VKIPSEPEQRFDCEWKGYAVTGALCCELQATPREKAAERNQYCASGACDQGKKVAAALARSAPPAANSNRPIAAREAAAAASDYRAGKRTCSGFDGETCDRLLSKMNEDGLCPKHRAARHRTERAAEVATVEVAPPPKPATPVITEEPMSEKTCTVEDCDEPLRSNNMSGLCKNHKRLAKPKTDVPAAPPRRPAAKQSAPAVASTMELPPVASLPEAYVEEVIESFKQRVVRQYRLAKSLGFDPAVAARELERVSETDLNEAAHHHAGETAA